MFKHSNFLLAKAILARCHKLSLREKLRFWQRWLCTPYLEVEKFVPREGKILDLGCGWGWFSQLLALTSKGRQVFGFDISLKRLKETGRVYSGNGYPLFGLGTLAAVRGGVLQAIVIYDVLHHLNYQRQEKCLAQAWDCLSKGGILVIKENNTSPRWKYIINYIIEIIAIAIGYTVSEPLSFRREEEWESLLQKSGFRTSILRLNTWHLWPHLLIVGRKWDDSF